MAFPEDNKSASISKAQKAFPDLSLPRKALESPASGLCGVVWSSGRGRHCSKHWNNIEQSAARVGKDRREISHK